MVKKNNELQKFEKECRKWICFFGLTEWRWSFAIREDAKYNAETRYDVENKSAVVTVSSIPFAESTIEKVAFHEVAEMMLVGITHELGYYVNGSIVRQRAHEIVRRLENSVFEEINNKK